MENRSQLLADFSITPVAAGHPALSTLISDQEVEVARRYGGDERDPPVSAEAIFLLLRLGGEAVGCVAVAPLEPGVGELKRMYVAPAHRGNGLGRLLLRAFDRAAVAAGYAVVRLETGDAQPEAVRLYETSGWRRIPPYGRWKDSPRSICFEKQL
jgi:GNAT superfamily N-acetyltransferase